MKIQTLLRLLCLLLLSGCLHAAPLMAQSLDPLDPFSRQESPVAASSEADDRKSANELIEEAVYLLYMDERPLDARTKLLKALAREPKDHRAHVLLAEYYLQQVGYFRLALRYALRAMDLFQEKSGTPPYYRAADMKLHDHLLYLLSQIKLNLDDYQGALALLDEHVQRGYYNEWFAGSRAWVLMKMGRLSEAEKEVRAAISNGTEPGRNMNVLAIILSMLDKRQEAIQIFKEAIEYELSLGSKGHPATPLNNLGEVYNEIFSEEQAENAWNRSRHMPDGCEHILPSLNLSMLYMEQANYVAAREAIDSFESCYAQFPLRNGEEHRALAHLARGRIDLRSGRIDAAIEHLEQALQKQQWFGKIGTSTDDLRTAAMTALAQALQVRNNILRLRLKDGVRESISSIATRIQNSLRASWLKRRARQILTEDLNSLEDLHVRNTDSLLEYATLGELLAGIWQHTLERRIAAERAGDKRAGAQVYYDAYLAESALRYSGAEAALPRIQAAISATRMPANKALRAHLTLLELSALEPESDKAVKLAWQIFSENPAALRSKGLALPVRLEADADTVDPAELRGSAFLPSDQALAEGTLRIVRAGERFSAGLRRNGVETIADGRAPAEALNALADKVFAVE